MPTPLIEEITMLSPAFIVPMGTDQHVVSPLCGDKHLLLAWIDDRNRRLTGRNNNAKHVSLFLLSKRLDFRF
ncbi:MAG TPA: hypothetical protein VIS56_01330, partial [Candidatus Saccharimonadales bacterium]